MNYFELYDISPGFSPDPAEVKKKFYELSRKYHPDRFSMAEDSAKEEALRMSAMNNQAYKTLSNADATMAYLLKQQGLLEDEEKYQLPPAFLMEMMELNEAISDYEMEPENEAAGAQAREALQEQLQAWEQTVSALTAKYDHTVPDTVLLEQIKDHYFRKKYLLRIKERIDSFASR